MSLTRIKANHIYQINNKGKDYFVGDIHGHYSLLLKQLDDIAFDFQNDRLFAVGDIIDRGKESEKCIELLDEPWFFSTIGNHEHLFLKGFDDISYWSILKNNGGQWMDYWLDYPKKLLNWAQLIQMNMPLTITVLTPQGYVGISHADAPDDWSNAPYLAENDIASIIWKRQLFKSKIKTPIDNVLVTFHGHNQITKVKTINNQVWADTLQKTNRLSILSTDELFRIISAVE